MLDQIKFEMRYFVLVGVMCCGSLFGQTLSDQEIISLKDKSARAVRTLQYDSALYFLDAISEAHKNDNNLVEYHLNQVEKAVILDGMGRRDAAFEILEIAEKESAQLTESNLLFEIHKNRAILYEAVSDFRKSLELYELAGEHFIDDGTRRAQERLATFYKGRGFSLVMIGNFAGAEGDWLSSKRIYDSLGLKNHESARILSNLGGVTIYNGLLNQAVEYLTESIAVTVEITGNAMDPSLLQPYHNLANAYMTLRLNNRAIEYINKSMEVARSVSPDHPLIVQQMFLLTNIYKNMNNPTEGMVIIQNAMKLSLKTYGPKHPLTGHAHLLTGMFLNMSGKNTEAIESLNLALEILEQTNIGFDQRLLSLGRTSLAQTQIEMGDFEAGISNMLQAAQLTNKLSNGKGHDLSKAFGDLANAYYNSGNNEEALKYYHKSVVANVLSFESDNVFDNPNFENVSNNGQLFFDLMGKAMAFERLYDALGEVSYLEGAYKTIRDIEKVIAALNMLPDNHQDKLRLQWNISNFNIAGVRIGEKMMQLDSNPEYLTFVYSLFERNKSNLILANLQEERAFGKFDLPDSIANERLTIVKNLSYFESQIYELTSSQSQDTVRLANYQRQVFELRQQESELNDLIKQINPGHYQFLVKRGFTSIEEVQQQLIGEGEVMLHYQLARTRIHQLRITQDDIQFESIPIDDTFFDDLVRFLALCNQPQSSTREYLNLSKKILDKINLTEHVLSTYSKLLIIPDGALGLLPFEALVGSGPSSDSFKELNYLVKTHDISYANSATLLSFNKEDDQSLGKPQVAAFAPSYGANSSSDQVSDTVRAGLSNLAWTEQEVKNLSAYFDTKSFLKEEASEESFKEVSSDYEILHVASHGLINNHSPLYSKLVFSQNSADTINDGYMNTRELYAMNIPAKMVVLSACNTGSGNIISGEGVLSLASGFFYAGAQSLVMTLWTANDQSTASIMDDFYKNLSHGNAKSVSLRNAKLSYLEEADALRSHPYYWAHFVINGNNKPIIGPRNGWFLWLVGSMLLLALVIGAKRLNKSHV